MNRTKKSWWCSELTRLLSRTHEPAVKKCRRRQWEQNETETKRGKRDGRSAEQTPENTQHISKYDRKQPKAITVDANSWKEAVSAEVDWNFRRAVVWRGWNSVDPRLIASSGSSFKFLNSFFAYFWFRNNILWLIKKKKLFRIYWLSWAIVSTKPTKTFIW